MHLRSRRPEARSGEPDDVGVDRDLDDGGSWGRGLVSRGDAQRRLLTGAEAELTQALPLWRVRDWLTLSATGQRRRNWPLCALKRSEPSLRRPAPIRQGDCG